MSTELALIMNYKKKKMLKNPCSLPLLAICTMQCLSFQSELIVLAVGLTVLKMVRLAALMVVRVTVFTLLVFKDTICLLFKDTRLLIVILASPVM